MTDTSLAPEQPVLQGLPLGITSEANNPPLFVTHEWPCQQRDYLFYRPAK